MDSPALEFNPVMGEKSVKSNAKKSGLWGQVIFQHHVTRLGHLPTPCDQSRHKAGSQLGRYLLCNGS